MAATHASEKGFWNRDDVYQNIGFKHFFSQKDYSKEKKIGMALNDQQFSSNQLITWKCCENRSSRF